jgi:hypothetical protein
LPKGAYPLPEGGHAVDRDGVPVLVGSGQIRVDPEARAHPNLKLFARALLLLVEEQRQAAAKKRSKRP